MAASSQETSVRARRMSLALTTFNRKALETYTSSLLPRSGMTSTGSVPSSSLVSEVLAMRRYMASSQSTPGTTSRSTLTFVGRSSYLTSSASLVRVPGPRRFSRLRSRIAGFFYPPHQVTLGSTTCQCSSRTGSTRTSQSSNEITLSTAIMPSSRKWNGTWELASWYDSETQSLWRCLILVTPSGGSRGKR